MPVTLNASTSSGFIATSDTSGNLELQNNGTTRMTVSSSGVSFAAQPLIGGVAPPAFSAYLGSNQTLSSGTWTKLQINTEDFDTNSNYDPTTNYRFTPTVAGYYLISIGVAALNGSNTALEGAIYKNGAQAKIGYAYSSTSGGLDDWSINFSSLIYMNGTTDYVELYAFAVGATLVINSGATNTYFQGVMVRGA
jgi:hypothetical protein